MFCNHCGKEIANEADVCINCGRSVTGQGVGSSAKARRVNVGLCILCFFIPIVGVIYWAIMRDDDPKQANACGIVALISTGIQVVLSFFFSFLSAFLADLFYPMVKDFIFELFFAAK